MKNHQNTAGKENGKIADGAWVATELRVTKVHSLKSANVKEAKRTNASFTKKCRDQKEEGSDRTPSNVYVWYNLIRK